MAVQLTQEMIVQEVIKRLKTLENEPYVPIGVSNRHVHLSQTHLEQLFGQGSRLTKMKDLKQPGQFAAKETVTLIGPKGECSGVRVLGPTRSATQVEISMSDSFKLGVSPPIKESGNLSGTPGIILKGPRGIVKLQEGLIIAHRHIHVPIDFAERFHLKDKDLVEVEVTGIRQTIFGNVLIRVSDRSSLEMHLDTDEANAAGIQNGDLAKIRKG